MGERRGRGDGGGERWGRAGGRPPALCTALILLLISCGSSPLVSRPPAPVTLSPTSGLARQRWVIVRTPQLALAFDRASATLLARPVTNPGVIGATVTEEAGPGDAAGGVALRE